MTLPMNSSVAPADDLRALMAQHGLTNRDVAEIACVHVKTVESWLADPASANHRRMHLRYIRSIRAMLPAYLKAAKRGRKA